MDKIFIKSELGILDSKEYSCSMLPFLRQPKTKIKAVQEQDLIPYLKTIGLWGSIADGKEHCAYCGNVISAENLQALFPAGNEIKLICSRVNCMNKLQHDG